MENLIKTTFDKLEMDSEAKMTIKNNLLHARKRNYTWMRYAACAATFIAVLFVVPPTRAAIVNAAEYLTHIFHSADGAEIIYEKTDNMVKFSFEISDTEYTEVSDGRLYFVLGDVREDVTDLCSESTYYRYELANSDGSKSVIFVGGTVTDTAGLSFCLTLTETMCSAKARFTRTGSRAPMKGLHGRMPRCGARTCSIIKLCL